MVVFSCDGCAEVLKKSQVDAHANRCRSCASVSCSDCLVSFYGDDYRSHTSCMTEAERYEKTLYRPNNKKGKKRNPQEEWMDLIQRAGGNAAPDHLKQFLTNLAMLDNVPRKEKQFRNFTSNSLNHLRGRGDIVGEVYKYLSNMRQTENDARKLVQEKEAAAKKAEDERKQQEKEAATSSSTEEQQQQQQLPSAKKVTKTMKKIVKKEKGSIKFKLLRSRVSEALGLDKSMQKKLKKMLKSELQSSDTKIRLEGKLVKLE